MNLINSDCLAAMAGMPENSVDTIITDPPYGIGFMGKAWDSFDTKFVADKTERYTAHRDEAVKGGKRDRFASASSAGGTYDRSLGANQQFQEWCREWATAALRVAKPGACMLVSGGTRTYHRMACAIEDAGWEIRDCMMWLYGSGFPKSHNLKGEFEGWGTALKPAWEPIIVAMKPLDGTFAHNAEKHGVAGLNIDGSRIDCASRPHITKLGDLPSNGVYGAGINGSKATGETTQGRWPANLILDEACAELLDEQTGELAGAGNKIGTPKKSTTFFSDDKTQINMKYDNGGGASRFFYCAKASKSERNEGCEEMDDVQTTDGCLRANPDSARKYQANSALRKNHHPTVKPLKLMEYLCTLTKTPTGGIVLDPFMGSGTTGVACRNTGREFIGIEREEAYFKIAQARIASAKAA